MNILLLGTVDLGNNFLKKEEIFAEDMNMQVQPKSFHQRGSEHINLTLASVMSTIQPPF